MSSVSQSTSSGTSFIPDYPQSSFLQMIAGEANNYANQAYGRYDSTFQPLENALISDSNKFQSPGYLAQQAGAASSGAAQAGEAQRTNSLRDLEAFGIDPAGGRYAELDKAERGRTAATQAGAAQEAVRQTQAAGRQMRTEALNIGQQNLNRASHNLDTAASLKYPPLGRNDQSQSTSSHGTILNTGNNRSQTTQPRPSTTSGGGAGAFNPNAAYNPNWSGSGGGGNNPSSGGGFGGGRPGNAGPEILQTGSGSDVNGPEFTDFSAGNSTYNGGQTDPFADTYGGYNTGGGSNPGADQYDTSNLNNPSFTTDNSNPWGDNSTALDNSNTGGWPDQSYSSDTGSSGGDWSSVDENSGGGYAQGGAIDIQGGGHVPQDASPSQGQQTDDIQANVNADEFVIPKDVALWKGQEFFQTLIAKSRKARLTAPAHGSNDNGQPQPAMG